MEFLQRLLTFTLLQDSLSQSWSVWMPKSIQALKGSCVVIPCLFTYPESYRTSSNFNICWFLYKTHGYPEVYNSKGSQSVEREFRFRTTFVGDMENRNCSLQIDKVRSEDENYYYPIINNAIFSFWKNSVQVIVSAMPNQLSLSYPEIMSEGESVNISCSAEHSCPTNPPSLTWNQFGNKANIYQKKLKEGWWRTETMLSYSPSPEDHGKHLPCVATYPNGQQLQRDIIFNIRYPPQNTSLSVLEDESVKEGDSVILTCSSHSNPAVTNYSWHQGLHQEVLQHHGQQIIIKNVTFDSGPYYCKAYNALGMGTSLPLNLNVQYAPKGTRLVAPGKDQVHEGVSLVLRCESSRSNPAVTHYTWYKDENPIMNQAQETLQIQQVKAEDAGVYRCAAHNNIGNLSSTPVTIHITNYDHSSTYIAILGGVTGMICLLLIGLGVFIVVRKRKMQKTTALMVTVPMEDNNPIAESAIPRTVREEIPLTDEHIYWNVPLQRPSTHFHTNNYASSSRHPEEGHPAHSEAMDPGSVYMQVKKRSEKKQNQRDQHHLQPADLHYSVVLHEQPDNVHYSTMIHSQPEEPQYGNMLLSQLPRNTEPAAVKDLVEYAAVKY